MTIDLSTPAEKVLKEILEHKTDKGACDVGYWIERFNNASIEDDDLLRSCFKELSDNELVNTRWADGGPYIMTLTAKGISYFDMKKEQENKERKEKRRSIGKDLLLVILGAVITKLGDWIYTLLTSGK